MFYVPIVVAIAILVEQSYRHHYKIVFINPAW